MANHDLVEYLKKTRSAGIPDQVVEEKLLQSGWPYDEIVDAFNELNPKESRIQVLSRRYLSKFSVFALAICFLFPPLGLALAFYSRSRMKRYANKDGYEFTTAAFAVGIIGTLSMSYIGLAYLGYLTGVSNLSGYVAKDCFFPKDFRCLHRTKVSGTTYELSLRNDMEGPITVTGARMPGCENTSMVDMFPRENVKHGERFTVSVLCEGGKPDKVEIDYMEIASGQNITFRGRV